MIGFAINFNGPVMVTTLLKTSSYAIEKEIIKQSMNVHFDGERELRSSYLKVAN